MKPDNNALAFLLGEEKMSVTKNIVKLVIEYEDARRDLYSIKKARSVLRDSCSKINDSDCINISVNGFKNRYPDDPNDFWDWIYNSDLCDNCRKWLEKRDEKQLASKRLAVVKRKLSHYGKILRKTNGAQ